MRWKCQFKAFRLSSQSLLNMAVLYNIVIEEYHYCLAYLPQIETQSTHIVKKNALLVNSTNRIHLIVEIAQCKALFAETQCLNWIPLLYMGLVGTPP